MTFVIDRRLNPGGKNLANRQRFIRRAKSQIRKAVSEKYAKAGSIKDSDKGGDISLSSQGIREPSLRRSGSGGIRDHLLPGNKEYLEGDTIPRPPSGGGGRGSEGSPDGEGEDEFRFVLSRDEFIDLFLEDLELPDLVKRNLATTEAVMWEKAGYSVSGSPANLALLRTVRNSMSRRIALRRPKLDELATLREDIRTELDPERKVELEEELSVKLRRVGLIPYIDPIDVRYRKFESHPKPISQAVMFALMDVSGSMNEHMKDLAKRFYTLLYIFLKRNYKHVDVVFIRHSHVAQEVDEDTFFNSKETGGTVVSTALEEMMKVVKDRYNVDDWNVYVAQASDGDNTSSDDELVENLLVKHVLPICQYFAYLEVGNEQGGDYIYSGASSSIWKLYTRLKEGGVPLEMRKIKNKNEIYPVFRELFSKKEKMTA